MGKLDKFPRKFGLNMSEQQMENMTKAQRQELTESLGL